MLTQYQVVRSYIYDTAIGDYIIKITQSAGTHTHVDVRRPIRRSRSLVVRCADLDSICEDIDFDVQVQARLHPELVKEEYSQKS